MDFLFLLARELCTSTRTRAKTSRINWPNGTTLNGRNYFIFNSTRFLPVDGELIGNVLGV